MEAFAKMLAAAVDDSQTAGRYHEARARAGGGWLRTEARLHNFLHGAEGAEWILLLEDDLDFHPRIGAAVASWGAARGKVMATLFNPGLREMKTIADGQLDSEGPPATAPYLPPAVRLLQSQRQFAADPKTFLGAQALLLRVPFARHALAKWNTVTGMQSQRLAKLHEAFGSSPALLVH